MLYVMAPIEIAEFHKNELPEKWFYQIISFLRMDDPGGFEGSNKNRNYISSDDEHQKHFIISSGDILISHAEVLRKELFLKNIFWCCFGLGGVLTYPAYRRQGYGTRIVRLATEYIMAQPNADFALLSCKTENREFYKMNRWEFPEILTVNIGPRANPEACSEDVGILFISSKAKKRRTELEHTPIYFGDGMW